MLRGMGIGVFGWGWGCVVWGVRVVGGMSVLGVGGSGEEVGVFG